MRRKVTKEEFKKVLDTLFPWGYTGDLKDWENGCFLGWAYINRESHTRDVMCVNQDTGGIAFWLINHEDTTPDMVTGAIDGMMHALIPGMVSDDAFGDGRRTVIYMFPDEPERDFSDRERRAADIVQEVLDGYGLDDNEVTGISLYDNGNSVQVTITGGVEYKAIRAVGEAFGDPEPNVYAEGRDTILLVILNETHGELKQ